LAILPLGFVAANAGFVVLLMRRFYVENLSGGTGIGLIQGKNGNKGVKSRMYVLPGAGDMKKSPGLSPETSG
jgi:hypothetical protein